MLVAIARAVREKALQQAELCLPGHQNQRDEKRGQDSDCQG